MIFVLKKVVILHYKNKTMYGNEKDNTGKRIQAKLP